MANKGLIQRYDSLLASYAVHHAGDQQREHTEEEHPDKLPFQRDRDRIIHSKAFRRLKHKTQVVVNPKNDHYRERLTHSIEGSQIARSIARSLQLNEDLAEAAILAHDLGHPPFGHEGEYALDEVLKPLGYSFDHNQHSLRIVTRLEKSYPDFDGLNLTRATLNAINKHASPWENPKVKMPHGLSLEAQVMDKADEITYYAHDIDDGLRARILNLDEMSDLEIIQKADELIKKRYPDLKKEDWKVYKAQLVRSVIHILILDINETTLNNIKAHGVKTVTDVYNIAEPISDYSPEMKEATLELRKYLYKNFYQSKSVHKHTKEGKKLLQELFTRFYENPDRLPEHIRIQIDNPDPKAIVIKDYIAGMTDTFARDTVMQLKQRLF